MEKEYVKHLEKVTEVEFEARIGKVFNEDDVNSLLLAGSRDFALVILEEIHNSDFNNKLERLKLERLRAYPKIPAILKSLKEQAI